MEDKIVSILEEEKKDTILNREKDKYSLALASGKLCKQFRESFLKVSLEDMCELYGINVKNLNEFENTESNTLDYIFYYYDTANNYEREIFEYSFFREVIASVKSKDNT